MEQDKLNKIIGKNKTNNKQVIILKSKLTIKFSLILTQK